MVNLILHVRRTNLSQLLLQAHEKNDILALENNFHEQNICKALWYLKKKKTIIFFQNQELQKKQKKKNTD